MSLGQDDFNLNDEYEIPGDIEEYDSAPVFMPNAPELSSDSFELPSEPPRLPEVTEIVNFTDAGDLKQFIKDNFLDESWYIVMNVRDHGLLRVDRRPKRSKVHPCHLFRFK